SWIGRPAEHSRSRHQISRSRNRRVPNEQLLPWIPSQRPYPQMQPHEDCSEILTIACKTICDSRWLALKYRQVVIGYLQDDKRHRRAILVTDHIRPEARRGLAADQLVSDCRVPLSPFRPTPQPHRLGRVVMSVIVVAIPITQLDFTDVLAQITDAVA